MSYLGKLYKLYLILITIVAIAVIAIKINIFALHPSTTLLMVIDQVRVGLSVLLAAVFWYLAVGGIHKHMKFLAAFMLTVALIISISVTNSLILAPEGAPWLITVDALSVILPVSSNTIFSLYLVYLILFMALGVVGLLSFRSSSKLARQMLIATVLFASSFMVLGSEKSVRGLSLFPMTYIFETAVDTFRAHYNDTPASDSWNRNFDASDQTDARPNIALIIMESTRLSATSIGQQEWGDTTPFLRKLASNSYVNLKTQVTLPHTSKSLVSILCGIYPDLRTPIFESAIQLPVDCLPKALGRLGYNTHYMQVAISEFENRRGLIQNFGFDSGHYGEDYVSEGFDRVNYFGYADSIMLADNTKLLNQLDAPFLMTYLTNISHHDYQVPSSHKNINDIAEKTQDLPWYQSDLSAYLNTINYADELIKQIFDQYKEHGLYDNTIFIIVGDHGEAFYERPFKKFHNNVLNTEVADVPLIIHGPKFVEAKISHKAGSTLDIMPTVLELIGLETQGFTGRSFINEEPSARKLFAACWYITYCFSVSDQQYRYIHNFGKREDELYDRLEDPQEAVNLIKSSDHQAIIESFFAEGYRWYFAYRSEFRDHYKSLGVPYSLRIQDTTSPGFRQILLDYNKRNREQN